ncbi:hypothetical protein GCM10022214_01950 [Actinomadura miaoliensis]|uniref:Uncharacterized protein n=1 Tax=Actinomadura miaoliensis TaxID=430685 RepID=A0ABP7UX75_9ACTN
MVSNAPAGAGLGSGAEGPDGEDAQVRLVLEEHHAWLRAAMTAALETSRSRSQLRPGVEVEATADVLAHGGECTNSLGWPPIGPVPSE